MTVCWDVDDLNVPQKEESAIDLFVLKIFKVFKNGTKFSRVKVHEYLGMDMNWSQDGTMIVSMIMYLQKIIDVLLEVIRSTSAMYVAEYLFTVQGEKDRKMLPGDLLELNSVDDHDHSVDSTPH